MKLTNYLVLAAAVLSLGFCTSCNDSDNGAVAYFTDIVTLDASNDKGSVMTFQVKNDSPLVTLTSPLPISKENVGKRIVIVYSPIGTVEHGVSAKIDVLNAGMTYGGGAAPTDAVVDSLNNWESDVVNYMQAYRSGKYLNLGMTLPIVTTPEKFRCYVDVTTLDSEYPELHVVYKAKGGTGSISANFFGSYDISNIWHRPGVKGLKVFYNGMNEKSTTIEKETSTKPAE